MKNNEPESLQEMLNTIVDGIKTNEFQICIESNNNSVYDRDEKVMCANIIDNFSEVETILTNEEIIMENKNVNHPNHYNQYPIEVIDIIKDVNFCIGNVIKYVLRAPYKGKGIEDCDKALVYLQWSRSVTQQTTSRTTLKNVSKLLNYFNANLDKPFMKNYHEFMTQVYYYFDDPSIICLNRMESIIKNLKDEINNVQSS